jgi:hypothetical protein
VRVISAPKIVGSADDLFCTTFHFGAETGENQVTAWQAWLSFLSCKAPLGKKLSGVKVGRQLWRPNDDPAAREAPRLVVRPGCTGVEATVRVYLGCIWEGK